MSSMGVGIASEAQGTEEGLMRLYTLLRGAEDSAIRVSNSCPKILLDNHLIHVQHSRQGFLVKASCSNQRLKKLIENTQAVSLEFARLDPKYFDI